MTKYPDLIARIAPLRAAVEVLSPSDLDLLLGIARDVAEGRGHVHDNPVSMSLLGGVVRFKNATKPSVTKAVGLLADALAQDIKGSREHAQFLRDECDRVLLGLEHR